MTARVYFRVFTRPTSHVTRSARRYAPTARAIASSAAPPFRLRAPIPARRVARVAVFGAEQVLRRAAGGLDRRGRRRGRAPEGFFSLALRHQRSAHADHWPGGGDRGNLGRRVAVSVPVRRALAEPGAESSARSADGGVSPRSEAGDGVVREHAHGQPDVHSQRRHQSDGALFERGRERSDSDCHRVGAGRGGVLRARPEDRVPRIASRARHHLRGVLVPAPPGTAIRSGS